VIAEAQGKGRGQRGQRWLSSRGLGLYLSVLLRPELAPRDAPLLCLAGGLAAARAIDRLAGVDTLLKRPNDLLIGSRLVEGNTRTWRKIGGLHVDTAVQGEGLRHAIISLGLNVSHRAEDFPARLRPAAASLLPAVGDAPAREDLAAGFLGELELLLTEVGNASDPARVTALKDACRERTVDPPDYLLPELSEEELT
jgi:BirA family biotin operon repressor/biotin-[acetyl-CoA-carboxylase] ligase